MLFCMMQNWNMSFICLKITQTSIEFGISSIGACSVQIFIRLSLDLLWYSAICLSVNFVCNNSKNTFFKSIKSINVYWENYKKDISVDATENQNHSPSNMYIVAQ